MEISELETRVTITVTAEDLKWLCWEEYVKTATVGALRVDWVFFRRA